MKKIAVLSGMGIPSASILAAIAATGSQHEIVTLPYTNERKLKPSESSRITKKWYTVDSPEVKRMSR